MRKSIAILLGAAVVGVRFGYRSNDRSNHYERSERTKGDGEKRLAVKAMDTNSDGMISQEFMKYHETVWQKVKRNAKDTPWRTWTRRTRRARFQVRFQANRPKKQSRK